MMMKHKGVRAVLRRVLVGLLSVILTLSAGFAIYVTIQRYIFRNPAPSVFGYAALVIISDSMSGTLDVGDLIIIRQCSAYAVGDIITFQPSAGDLPVTHRVVGEAGDRLKTKGDCNAAADTDPVSRSQVYGKVVSVIPGAGLFFEWLKTGEGMFSLIMLYTVLGAWLVSLGWTSSGTKATS